jgi:hypothetical protein
MGDIALFLFAIPQVAALFVVFATILTFVQERRQLNKRLLREAKREAERQARKQRRRRTDRVTAVYNPTSVSVVSRAPASIQAPLAAESTRPWIRGPLEVLDFWSTILPARVNSEDLGDYVQDIISRMERGQRVRVVFRVWAAILWTGVNAIGYFLKQIGRQRAT